jgi:two-component system CheB/CheR fusion protein
VTNTENATNEAFYTIGIGASAGGLEALERFFHPLPDAPGMAFVVIQHLSPDYKSMMAEILSKYTSMPVCVSEDGMPVKPNHVYLIPPKKTMTMSGGRLFLTEKEIHRGISLPIDTFFHSLALDRGEYAIGVVLSGTGSDGTRGIRTIKENDGMVVVQEASSAKFDAMPTSAINTGLADYILPPEKISQALLNFIRHPNLTEIHAVGDQKDGPVPPGGEISRILDITKTHSDVDFHQYKPNTVLRRIERRASIRQCSNIAEYLKLLESSGTEQDILYRELLIGVTKFFRDPEVFAALYQEAIPKLFASITGNEPLRVWVAGCSTGEEAYSLAILLAEAQAYLGHTNREIKIFATDIDQHAIDTAAAGIYPESIAADVEPERLSRYFIRDEHEGRYTVTRAIRSMVVFARHDLTKSPPFNRLDLISCRNLFIYLRPEMQERILDLFHFALKPSGFLLLGGSETVGESDKVFACLDNRHKLYQARSGIAPTVAMRHNVTLLQSSQESAQPRLRYNTGRGVTQQTGDYLQNLVMNKLLPPCILITDNLDALYISRQASKYLTLSGTPAYNLIYLMEDSTAAFVRSAVVNAIKNNRTVVYKMLDNPNTEDGSLEISVEPLAKKHGGAQLLLLTIHESALPKHDDADDITTLEISADTRQHIEELERELTYTRETLQATIEELETSNEELQSTNEELLASNEELQSTNEELQAVNEELITVNSEHQHKIQEITALNETHTNLLRSSGVGSVFLDSHFCIRSFTPAAREVISLRENDLGRPFEEIRHHLQIDDLHRHLERTVREIQMFDLEVSSNQGNWYILRISPFLRSDNSVDGVVLTFMNISERKRAEQEIRAMREHLQLAVESGEIGIWELDLRTRALTWDDRMFQLYGVARQDFSSAYDAWRNRLHPDDLAEAEAALNTVIDGRQEHFDHQFRVLHPNGVIRYLRARAKVSHDEAGRPTTMIGINWDQTAEFRTTHLLQATQRIGNIGSWELDVTSMKTVWTEEVYRIHELEPGTPTDTQSGIEYYHPDDRPRIRAAVTACIEQGSPFDLECRFTTAKGHELWVRAMGEAVYVGGKVIKLQGLFQDITEHKQAELKLIEAHHQAEVAHQSELKLLEAHHQAEAANQAKSMFLANMSHELRTPLNAVLGYAQLVQQSPDLAENLRDYITKIRRGGDYLLTLINDILDLSKIEVGRIELSLDELETRRFFEDISDMFRFRAKQKGIEYHYHADASLPHCLQADIKRLRQVVLNLLGNAIKFTTQGYVDLSVAYQNGYLQLCVEDTGIGIAGEDLQTIFHPFTQTGDSRYKAQGTGLGLSITRKIVELMGGEISVDSELGQGSRFHVRIPLEASFNHPAAVSDGADNMPQREIIGYRRTDRSDDSLRILIVDDIADNREVLVHILSPLDFSVQAVDSGEACVEQAAQFQPDTVLMDMRMPGINGLEAMQQLHALPGMKNLPVIIISASVYHEDRETALQQGCVAYLNKPIEQQVLFQTLEKYLPLAWKYATSAPNVTPQEISNFPAAWLDALAYAVSMGNRRQILALLQEQREQGTSLPDKLQARVEAYEYPYILKWIKQIYPELQKQGKKPS